jgi:hypothetical protein
MMKTDNLGRLERVSLREIWESEPRRLYPWLAKDINLKLLGDTLGIELQLEAVRKGHWPLFSRHCLQGYR